MTKTIKRCCCSLAQFESYVIQYMTKTATARTKGGLKFESYVIQYMTKTGAETTHHKPLSLRVM